ncbi:lipase 1-like [Spodoptera litura]|uniref:Lipase n=1 Tax=Spodoptera litura TaxID=69820 RepID=A0A9J7EXI2_SPOLT|nr:lipase 1-like [Spodoptera litura]
MNKILIRLVIVSAIGVLSQTSRNDIPEDATMTFSELADKYGHKAEEHDVISGGGYILTLFHIPGDKHRPILLIHGAIDSADSYIMRGNTSLAIALARDKYDVWVMNYRGNRYARRHTSMDADSNQEYWDFSLTEIGYYDVPANIDYVLKKTGEDKLSVIGYSEGTTSMYLLGATRPEYNDKVKIFISLAPVCTLKNTKPLASIVIQLAPLLNVALEMINSNELMGQNSTLRALFTDVCSRKAGYEVCLINGLFLLTGADAKEIEPEFFPVVVGHFPAGTSRKNINHLVQISLSGKFRDYDYGMMKNMEKYRRFTPPEYDLSKVTMKVALIAAKNDKLSTIKDVEWLREQLPNVVDYTVMKSNVFNHVDYIWGRTAHKTLFPHIFRLLNKYNK